MDLEGLLSELDKLCKNFDFYILFIFFQSDKQVMKVAEFLLLKLSSYCDV